jgi:hypothetical protein
MDEQLSEVFIAALADPGKPGLSARCRLLRNQTEPRREVATLGETLRLADGRDQRRGDCHAYPRNRDQKPSRFVRLYEDCELLLEFLYAAVEFAPLSAHVADQFYHSWAQA